MDRDRKRIFLFDVDGTLTVPRQRITPDMLEFLKELRKTHYIGMVGGSDLSKQEEQIGNDVLELFDYAFPENGLRAFKDGELIAETSISTCVDDDELQQFLNYILHYIADLRIPVKRGTFIEFRTGLINVSPVGRNCSQEERIAFNEYDKVHHIRQTMVDDLERKFAHMGFKFSIGGQISFDVFPVGWDKTYCLQFVEKDGFEEIHFFGDKTAPGGNDYEIFSSDRTIGHHVNSYQETMEQIKQLL